MLALVSAPISTASSAGAPLAPHDAAPSSRLATFTLVRGGSSEGDYETLVNSRRCLRQALAAAIDYDDIAFHEGNVPLLIQRSLSQRMYHFRFADAREHGGFQVGALTYERARQLGRTEFVYPLGYHHMCHFMSMLWFQALRGYEYAMRVDEDVCITRMPMQSLAIALTSDYAFGLEIREAHQRTIETFNPWLANYMSSSKLLPTIPPLPTERIFFTNFFVARLAWWHHPSVLHFLQAVNSSGGVYAHRWGDAPIQTAALRLHGAPSSVVHLDMDYVHLSTQNRIVGGEETAFDAQGLVNEHFRRLVAMANGTNRSSNATSNSSNGSASGGNPSASPPFAYSPPSSPAPPAHPPMPPLIPAPIGFTSVGSLAQLRDAIKATPPGGQLRVFLPPDAEYRLGGEEIVVGSIDLTLVSSGSGATLDAHHESRLFKVQNGASLHLSLISLLNGFSESGGGAMVVLSSSVSLSACLIVNSSSNLRGGVFSMDGSSLTVAGGSRIQNSASSFYAGVLYMLRSSAIVTDGTLISNSTSTIVGGVLGLINGAVLISNRTVIRSSSSQYGGALAVEAGTMRMSESYVFSSRCSMSGGAVAMVTGSTIIENGCMFSDSRAGDTAGAFAITGGVLKFRSSSILDSASTSSGGAIVISGGYVNLIGSRIVNSTSTQGGAIEISAGFLNMSHASTVTRSVSSRVGGGLFVHGGSVLIDGNCVLEHSYAQESGAAMFVVTGSVVLQRSSVVDSIAMQYGGALYISGSGSVTISRSLVARSRAGSAGGCFYAGGGELMLVSSTAEDCTSSDSVGGVLSVSSANVGHGPLMLLTSTDFRLRVCEGSLFEQQGNAQFILRNLTFTPLEGCNGEVLSSPGAFVGLTTKTCGESYLEPIQGQWQMVCSSNTAGACEINSVPATILTSLTCSCPSPEYVNPSMEDPALAPYQPLGCLKPRMFKALEVVSNKVSISLVKPHNMFQQINATLVMQGNDFAHPARWEILNASAVHAIGWLKIPFTSGEIAGRDEVPIPIVAAATGLRERVAPYAYKLLVHVQSAIDIVTRTQALEVTLLVEARTSFAVWGKHHICVPSSQTTLNDTVTVGSLLRIAFTACDVDNLPVSHQLPSISDPRRFTAMYFSLTAFQERVRVDYVGNGVYEIPISVSLHGFFAVELLLEQMADKATRLTGFAACPDDRESILGGSCGCKLGYFKTSALEPCELCTEGQTSRHDCVECPKHTSSIPGSMFCHVCAAGYFLVHSSEPATSSNCRPCPRGASCPWNSTLETIVLLDQFWRLSPRTDDIRECPMSPQNNFTTCLGGASTMQCVEGYDGPECRLCSRSGQYFDESLARCLDCPWVRISFTGVLCVVLGCLLSLLVRLQTMPTRGLFLTYCSSRVVRSLRSLVAMGVLTKVKITLSFCQIMANLDSTYSVRMPWHYQRWMRIFQPLSLDWAQMIVPFGCLAEGFTGNLLIITLAPLALMLLVTFLCLLIAAITHRNNRHTERRKSRRLIVKEGLLMSASFTLLAAYIFVPTASSYIFAAWSCVGYGVGNGEQRYFLRRDLSVACYTPEHDKIISVALLTMLLWPIGVPLLFTVLLLVARRSIMKRRPTAFVRGLRFLTQDYKKEQYFFEVVDIVRRTVLTGWVLLLPENTGTARLIVAVFVSIFALVLTLTRVPYNVYEDQIFSVWAQLTLTFVFFGAGYLKAYEDVNALSEDKSLAQKVYGFTSAEDIVAVLVACSFGIIAAFLFSTVSVVFKNGAVATIRIKSTGREPELSFWKGLKYHLFLSHVWSTAQDAVATIKRQLQRLMPDASIFLDVDDLEDIGSLECYVSESSSILMYLSRGYFLSKNCQREVSHTIKQGKPFLLVHEADSAKGGGTLHDLMEELQDEKQRTYLFTDRKVTLWHRVKEFQLMSLLEIAEGMLLTCPAYKGQHTSLPLFVPGSLTQQKLDFSQPVLLYASPNNPGAADAATEFQLAFGVGFTSVRPAALVAGASRRAKAQSRYRSKATSFVDCHVNKIFAHASTIRESRKQSVSQFALSPPPSPPTGPKHSRSVRIACNGPERQHLEERSGSCPCALLDDQLDSGLRTLHASKSNRFARLRSAIPLLRTLEAGSSSPMISTVRMVEPMSPRTPGKRRVMEATHMLLYLSKQTFYGEPGQELAEEVRNALAAGMPVVAVHERDRDRHGPSDLVDSGIYKEVAVAFVAGEARKVSYALFAKAIGARAVSSIDHFKSMNKLLSQSSKLGAGWTGSDNNAFHAALDKSASNLQKFTPLHRLEA